MTQASEEEEEEEDNSEDESVADFANVPAPTPGKHGTFFIAKKTARRNEKEQSQVKKHFARRYETTPTSAPTTTAGTEEKHKEQPENELPHPEGDPEAINKAIKDRRVCFYHARGDVCPHQQAGCRFSHDETLIPFGYYPRDRMAALSETTQAEMEQTYGKGTAPSAAFDQEA